MNYKWRDRFQCRISFLDFNVEYSEFPVKYHNHRNYEASTNPPRDCQDS